MQRSHAIQSNSHSIVAVPQQRSLQLLESVGRLQGRFVSPINWKGYFLLGFHYVYNISYFALAHFSAQNWDPEKYKIEARKAVIACSFLMGLAHLCVWFPHGLTFSTPDSIDSSSHTMETLQRHDIRWKKDKNESLLLALGTLSASSLIIGTVFLGAGSMSHLDFQWTTGLAWTGMGAAGSLISMCYLKNFIMKPN